MSNDSRLYRSVTLLLAGVMLWFSGCAPAADKGRGDYFDALPRFWGGLYADGGETLYCGRKFGKRHGRDINVEHVFPMAWVTRALKCGKREECRQNSREFNTIEADMHNLFPALAEINKRRGAFAFAEIPGEPGTGKCDFEVDERKRLVEPRPAVRGDIARAMFYMSHRYGLKLFNRQKKMLLRWHREDPPSAEERRRNDIIQRLQGQRNPFIDNPRQVKLLFVGQEQP